MTKLVANSTQHYYSNFMLNFKGNFENQLAQYQKQVNTILAGFFDQKIRVAPFSNSTEMREILASLRHFILRGGKRLRGFLTLAGYELFGGKNTSEILKFSAAFEMVHAALLIHDDIVDQDKLRRGAPTIHKVFEKKYKSEKIGKPRTTSDEARGKRIAIEAAHFLVNFAIVKMHNTNFPIAQKIAAIDFLRKKIFMTALGEMLDIHFSGEKNISKKDILRIYQLKTASYTIEAPFFCGALLAGVKEKELAPYKNFVRYLGQAFQTKDDFLGIFGSEKLTGKSTTSDLKEGKMNLVLKEIEQNLSRANRKTFFQYFGKKSVADRKISKIKKTILNKSIYKKVETKISKSSETIKKIIKNLPINKFEKSFFVKLTRHILEREK